MAEFSRITVIEYLPVIKAIFASFEVQDKHFKGNKDAQRLSVNYLEKEYGMSKLGHAMRLIGIWLEGSNFKVEMFHFIKMNPDAEWSEMLAIIEAKIMEYSNDVPIIVLTLSSSGRITREVNGSVFTLDFGSDKFKARILQWLPDNSAYIKVHQLTGFIESTSDSSVRKLIGQINDSAQSKLQLPKEKSLIEGKHGSGYRINPIYNLVRLK